MTQSILVNSASKEEHHFLQLMSWPVQPAELNPIELLWDELGRKVRAKQPANAAHLWQLLQESWAELIEKMPRICEAVLVAKSSFCVFLLFVFNVTQEDFFLG